MMTEILSRLDELEERIGRLSERIEEIVRPYEEAVERLKSIPGVGRRAAEVIVAEVGAGMSPFPTAGHLVSWPACVPATMKVRANISRARPGRETGGFVRYSTSVLWRPSSTGARVLPRGTATSCGTEGTRKRSWRSRIRF